jgi:putative DNA-invertase from lambdoid prophage Rac
VILAYARTSTLRQAGDDKTTIDEQLARCRTVAQLRGPVSKYGFETYIDKGVSGSKPLEERPAGAEMLSLIASGDTVIVSKMDRIFRSGADALATIERFKKQKIHLILCDMGIEPVADSPVSTLFFSLLAAFAQFERERICERIEEGKRAKRERGGHAGGPVPFGFTKEGYGTKAILVPNEVERTHRRIARRHHAAGRLSYGRIARLMARDGQLGRDGTPYTRMAIYRMVNNG